MVLVVLFCVMKGGGGFPGKLNVSRYIMYLWYVVKHSYAA